MSEFIYLDNNATTRPLPEVVQAMQGVLQDAYANPSSVHQFGQSVRHLVETARQQVATMIHSSPREIVFTSGGTESINLAIRGSLGLHPDRRRIVTTAVEHSAVLRVMEKLESDGYEVCFIDVNGDGQLDEKHFEQSLNDKTALVSILHANNETGVIFDVKRLAHMASVHGIPVHVDAVQAAGKVPIDVTDWPVQLVSLSAHKFHGPKGTGALYVRRRTRLNAMMLGGSQERQMRGGTEHVAGIVGMGVAAQIAKQNGEEVTAAVQSLRDDLEMRILASIPFAKVNGSGSLRIYNTSNIAFERLQAEAILLLLSEAGICASSGAACSSGSLEPSHVLRAMGIDESLAHGSIRFSLSRFTTQSEIDQIVDVLPSLLTKLQRLSDE